MSTWNALVFFYCNFCDKSRVQIILIHVCNNNYPKKEIFLKVHFAIWHYLLPYTFMSTLFLTWDHEPLIGLFLFIYSGIIYKNWFYYFYCVGQIVKMIFMRKRYICIMCSGDNSFWTSID